MHSEEIYSILRQIIEEWRELLRAECINLVAGESLKVFAGLVFGLDPEGRFTDEEGNAQHFVNSEGGTSKASRGAESVGGP